MNETPGQTEQHQALKFEHTGRAGEIAPIAVVVGLLNIVTLSIYRFWGKTRVRKYLWGHTSLLGDPLEYTGTGEELFKGFMIVLFAVFVPLGAVSSIVDVFWAEEGGVFYSLFQLAFVVLILFLVGVAQYRARRYRLSRTLWRGIFGAQTGKPSEYGVRTLCFYILLPLTLGWTYPWQNMSLMSLMMNNTWFGDRRFSFEGGTGPLYKRFALTWAMVIGLIALPVLIGAVLSTAHAAGDGSVEVSFVDFLPVFFLLLLPLLMAFYQAGEMRYMASCTRYEGLTFTFDATVGSLVLLVGGNMLIMILTLSFGLPFAQMRKFRYFCDRLIAAGAVDFDDIRRSAESRPTVGEGLADAFDIDAI